MGGSSVLVTQKLVWRSWDRSAWSWRVTQVKTLFFCLNHLMIALVSLLKTHKFSKEKGCNLVYKVGHGLLLEERRAFDFCFFFFLKSLI